MSDTPTAAIAAVIDAHTPTGAEGNVTCWCDERFDSWVEHSEHVAAAVIAALGLFEETQYIKPWGYGDEMERRWVGPWQEKQK